MLTKLKFVGLAALATLWAGPALAAPQEFTMTLTANLGNSCILPATVSVPIDLVEPLTNGGFITGTYTLQVKCTQDLVYTVDLDDGGNYLAADGRRLKGGTVAAPVFIPYKVYRQSGNTSEWTAGIVAENKTGSGGNQDYVFSIKSTKTKSEFPSGATGEFKDTLKFIVSF